MIQKVTITETSIKEGKNEATGKSWTKLGIRTKEYGDKWLACFLNEFNKNGLGKIKKDDVMELVVEQSGDFLNFKIPGQYDRLEARVTALENGGKTVTKTAEEEYNDLNPDDIPF